MAGIIRIPDEAFGTQRIQPLPSVFQSTPQTTDADLGGDIGRGLAAAGDALGEGILGEAARRNEAAARDIDNRFAGEVRKALHDPERGYLAMRGRAALDASTSTYQALAALYDKHIGMAANPAQQQMARAVLDRRLRLASDAIAAHAVAQDAQWRDETRVARIDGAIADGVLARDDPAQLET
jgi:hypothetical protein